MSNDHSFINQPGNRIKGIANTCNKCWRMISTDLYLYVCCFFIDIDVIPVPKLFADGLLKYVFFVWSLADPPFFRKSSERILLFLAQMIWIMLEPEAIGVYAMISLASFAIWPPQPWSKFRPPATGPWSWIMSFPIHRAQRIWCIKGCGNSHGWCVMTMSGCSLGLGFFNPNFLEIYWLQSWYLCDHLISHEINLQISHDIWFNIWLKRASDWGNRIFRQPQIVLVQPLDKLHDLTWATGNPGRWRSGGFSGLFAWQVGVGPANPVSINPMLPGEARPEYDTSWNVNA